LPSFWKLPQVPIKLHILLVSAIKFKFQMTTIQNTSLRLNSVKDPLISHSSLCSTDSKIILCINKNVYSCPIPIIVSVYCYLSIQLPFHKMILFHGKCCFNRLGMLSTVDETNFSNHSKMSSRTAVEVWEERKGRIKGEKSFSCALIKCGVEGNFIEMIAI
jgi:hypothetical protein